jgi:hypothetical protein
MIYDYATKDEFPIDVKTLRGNDNEDSESKDNDSTDYRNQYYLCEDSQCSYCATQDCISRGSTQTAAECAQALGRTCQQIRAEVYARFYWNNTFRVHIKVLRDYQLLNPEVFKRLGRVVIESWGEFKTLTIVRCGSKWKPGPEYFPRDTQRLGRWTWKVDPECYPRDPSKLGEFQCRALVIIGKAGGHDLDSLPVIDI